MNSISIYDELDQAIGAMISEPDTAIATENAKFADVLRIVSDLRDLPRPDFKTRLKLELEWVASSRPLSSARQPQMIENSRILPSLFGNSYGTYPIQRVNFATSIALHAAAIVLVAVLGALAFKQKVNDVSQKTNLTVLSRYVPPLGLNEPKGGGGAGDNSKIKVSNGTPPRTAEEQFTPPAVEIRTRDSKLMVEPTIVAPDLKFPQSDRIGDPLSSLMTPSNGTGVRAGMGTGSSGGFGSGTGAGYGPGIGGGYGGGVGRVGEGITPPRVVYDPDPEYSPEARAARYQGTVKLWAIIGPDGRPHNLRVERSVGMGLDEKAIEAVRNWRFKPATKDGQAVAVEIEVEVGFHLY